MSLLIRRCYEKTRREKEEEKEKLFLIHQKMRGRTVELIERVEYCNKKTLEKTIAAIIDLKTETIENELKIIKLRFRYNIFSFNKYFQKRKLEVRKKELEEQLNLLQKEIYFLLLFQYFLMYNGTSFLGISFLAS
ncbi:MAG: hypothetical protein KAQ64_03775 [Candidatus Pacebacteria bacterium]|nr:hypothetical protein [Candidatus Paceibacterota bacterium]